MTHRADDGSVVAKRGNYTIWAAQTDAAFNDALVAFRAAFSYRDEMLGKTTPEEACKHALQIYCRWFYEREIVRETRLSETDCLKGALESILFSWQASDSENNLALEMSETASNALMKYADPNVAKINLAAPDLLRACKRVLANFGTTQPEYKYISAAIAKAEAGASCK